mmetsp:Transcript_17156/g.27056  ORF Transcript_17156/g.27056 Transcript_17156/m.27056 type:complete len:665 (+) Transcript_17156:249-2243(+)
MNKTACSPHSPFSCACALPPFPARCQQHSVRACALSSSKAGAPASPPAFHEGLSAGELKGGRPLAAPPRTPASSHEGLDVELQGGAWVDQIEVGEHLRVHHPEDAHGGLLLPPLPLPHQHHLRAPALEERRVAAGDHLVAHALPRGHGGGQVAHAVARVRRVRRHLHQRHHPVHQPVDHLEAGGETHVGRAEPALVARADGVGRVGEHHVRDLEQPHALANGHGPVVLDGLEGAREQHRAHHLVLDDRRVRQPHRGGPGPPQQREVLLRAAEAVREHLDVPGAGDLLPEQVGEVVDRLRLPHAQGGRRRQLQVVVPIGNGYVLDHVHRVEDVAPRGGHGDYDGVAAPRDPGGAQLHLGAEPAHLLGRDVDADRGVHLVHLGRLLARGEQRGGARAGLPQHRRARPVLHVHRLHGEGGRAVLGEHGDHGVQHDVGLGEVRGRALDEHIPGVKGDLAMITINDWWQRHHPVLGVVDDGVGGGVVNEAHIVLQVLAVRVGQVMVQEGPGVEGPAVRRHQGHERDVPGGLVLVAEGPPHGAQVVGADGHVLALAADVLVQLVLQVDEALVPARVEGHPAQDRAHHVRPQSAHRFFHDHLLARRRAACWLHYLVGRRGLLAEEHAQRPGEALQAEEVVPVGRDVNFVNDFFREPFFCTRALLFRGHFGF